MLSYQHEYHVGNHADVLKHATLALLIRALERKPTAVRVIDTHAGSGTYDLSNALTQRRREYDAGVARVFRAPDAPPCFLPYHEALEAANPDGRLARYPGSPELALSMLRSTDQLELFELHPQALASLRASFAGCGQVHIHARDAHEGLVAVVPPRERRGVVFVDPSYEEQGDFRRIADLLAKAYRRWPTGVYAVWYPVLARSGSDALINALSRLVPRCFRIELVPDPAAIGLRGSGLIVLNLPYGIDAELSTLAAWLDAKLSRSAQSTAAAGWL